LSQRMVMRYFILIQVERSHTDADNAEKTLKSVVEFNPLILLLILSATHTAPRDQFRFLI
jgi:hypothetical protein